MPMCSMLHTTEIVIYLHSAAMFKMPWCNAVVGANAAVLGPAAGLETVL